MLLISVEEGRSIRVGSLGIIDFEQGFYAYIGSAQRDLEKRILRHFSRKKKIFWHIDYLLNDESVKIIDVFFKVAPRIEECRVARVMGKLNKPIIGFGSSDCCCESHLFKVVDYENLKSLLKEMGLNSIKSDLALIKGSGGENFHGS